MDQHAIDSLKTDAEYVSRQLKFATMAQSPAGREDAVRRARDGIERILETVANLNSQPESTD